MSVNAIGIARVSTYQRSNVSLSAIARAQRDLLNVQTQIDNGTLLNKASDNPGAAQIAIGLQRALEKNKGYEDNLKAASSRLSLIDSSLGSATDLLQQVQSLASSNIGADVSAETRKSAAAVVHSLYSQLLSQANSQLSGLYLFGGDKGASAPYVESAGGVRYVGSSATLRNAIDDTTSVDINLDGGRIFGGTSTAVQGSNLEPNLTAATRLSDLRGANGNGINKGSILVSDGTSSQVVDLSKADTVADVLAAINATGLATATISGNGITLTGSPTANLTVNAVGGNSTASDLGILLTTGGGAGVPLVGASTDPAVTGLTPLSALRNGAGLNLTGGLRITNGTAVYNLSFAGATTVQDVINIVNRSGSGAEARINEDGTGIDIINPTQGIAISVSDNGGVLASQLGVRSFSPATALSQLNNGRGVQTGAGDDIQITAKDGSLITVDLDGARTVQDVLDRINAAGGGNVTATFSNAGNGIVLTDSTGGSGPLTVGSLNATTAAADLGIAGTTTGASLQGTDVNPVRSTGVFDNLLQLAAALERNDTAGITQAAEGLKADLDRIIAARGANGAKVQELDSRIEALADHTLATKSMLSEIKDLDYTEAITRYQLIQTLLQASYATTAQSSQLSLMNYLR